MTNQLTTVKTSLSRMEGQFKAALPSHIPAEKFVRTVQTAISNNPKLATCDQNQLLGAAMKAAQTGLMPDGREAALIPYGPKVNFIPMLAGVLKLIRNSGEVACITSQVIYEGDEFRYWVDNEGENLRHNPEFFKDRGNAIGVYAYAKTKDGACYIEVLTMDQIMKIKKSAAKGGPWDGDFKEEMWRKSAIKRLSKRLPMSTDVEQVFSSDEEFFKTKSEAPVVVDAPSEEVIAIESKPKAKTTKKKSKLDSLVEEVKEEDVPL